MTMVGAVLLGDAVVCYSAIQCEGVGRIGSEALRKAHGHGERYRLLARAELNPDGTYSLWFVPKRLPVDHPLARLGTKQMGIVYRYDLFGEISATIHAMPSACYGMPHRYHL